MADTSTKSNTVTTTASSSRMDLQKWDTLRHQRRLQSRSAANKSQCNGSLFRMGPKLSATATYHIIPLHSRDTCQTQSRCLKVWVVTDAAGIMHVGHLSTRMARLLRRFRPRILCVRLQCVLYSHSFCNTTPAADTASTISTMSPPR